MCVEKIRDLYLKLNNSKSIYKKKTAGDCAREAAINMINEHL